MNRLLFSFLILVSWGLVFPVHASLKEEINSFFDWFYEDKTTENMEALDLSPQIAIPKLYQVPEKPTVEDLTDVRRQLFEIETSLQAVENQLQAFNKLDQTQAQQEARLEQELFLLEEEEAEAEMTLEELKAHVEALDEQIVVITKEKTILRSLYQIAEKEYERFMQKQYQRKNMWGGGEGLFFLHWIFSDQAASDVLMRHRRDQQAETEKRNRQKELLSLRQQYEAKERDLLIHYGQKHRLLKTQESLLSRFRRMSESRQDQLLAVRKDDLYRDFEREELQRQKTQLTIQRDHLSAAQTKIDTYLKAQNIEVTSGSDQPYAFPVAPPVEITARFRDPEYEARVGREHDGVDFAVDQGSPVYAIDGGVIEKVHLGGLDYSFVLLRHDDGRYSTYGHLSSILVNEGDAIIQGQEIARSGGTPGTFGAGPWSSGPHLHLSIFGSGGFVDPLKLLPKIVSGGIKNASNANNASND